MLRTPTPSCRSERSFKVGRCVRLSGGRRPFAELVAESSASGSGHAFGDAVRSYDTEKEELRRHLLVATAAMSASWPSQPRHRTRGHDDEPRARPCDSRDPPHFANCFLFLLPLHHTHYSVNMSHIAGVLAARHFSQKDVPSLVGRKYLITGGAAAFASGRPRADSCGLDPAGSNGIGLSAARTLYSHGAEVTIIGSQKVRGNRASRLLQHPLLMRSFAPPSQRPMPPSSTSAPGTCQSRPRKTTPPGSKA